MDALWLIASFILALVINAICIGAIAIRVGDSIREWRASKHKLRNEMNTHFVKHLIRIKEIEKKLGIKRKDDVD